MKQLFEEKTTPRNREEDEIMGYRDVLNTFESLNSTGLGLDESDKIRNYVLMGMPAAKQETFYKKYWEPLERLVSHNDMKTFIRYYLSVKTRDLFKEDKLYFRFSKLRLNEYVKNCESWGESEILERARQLYKLAEQIWPMAETDYESQEEDNWICWDDEDYDFTNKTILKIVLISLIPQICGI